MRFMNGLNNIIMSLLDPKTSKVIVETLGFQHLDLEVTIPRVVIFRDAIVDLLTVEMGARLSKKAKDGWAAMLNWVGGAYIYIRLKFTDRLKILASSWATANNRNLNDIYTEDNGGEDGKNENEGEEAATHSGE